MAVKYTPPPSPFHIPKNGAWVDGRTDEEIWFLVRRRRNEALLKSDWTQIPDSPLTEEKRKEFAIWRDKLRNVTNFATYAKEAEAELEKLLEEEPTL